MTVSQGDIAFVGINTTGTADWFSVVALNAIAAGEVIYFTDNELASASDAAFNGSPTGGESYIKWVAPAGGVAAGAIIEIELPSSQASQPTATTGTASWVSFSGSTGAGLSATQESIYAYTAASDATVNTPVTYLGVISIGSSADPIPTGLDAKYAIAFGSTAKSAYYSYSNAGQANIADYAPLIDNTANWTTSSGETTFSGRATAPFIATPLSSLAIDNVSITEGNSGTNTVTFTVTLSAAAASIVTVDYATVDGLGLAGSDYVAKSGTLTFAVGETSKTVSVTVNGDTAFEANESFYVQLTNPTNALIADNEGKASIINDDLDVTYGSGYVDAGGIRVYDAADSTLHGDTTTPVATNDLVMVRLGSIQGASAGAESVAFADGKVYATNVNGNTINVHAVAADGTLSNLAPIALSGLTNYKTGGVNSVAVSHGVIAVAYENATAGTGGYIALFDATDNSLIKTVQVGVLPDQVTFTPDGTKILVANEAEAISTSNNPVGSVSIIDLSTGAANAGVQTTISFDALNGLESVLKAQGLALYSGQSAAADIEPEYISVSADGTRAYVTLQEVNAVAVIDLTNPTATKPLAILPLGSVDHNLAGNAFDASDRDGAGGTAAINLQNADVLGLLQPDAIASFTVGGETYFVTANEGDSRVGTGFADSTRLSSASYVLDPSAYPNAAALKADAVLGRLNVLTNVGDTDGDGDIDQIYTLGGRSMTIFRQNADGTITKVSETGGEFEAIIAANYAALFNSNQSTSSSSVDTRSDDKGPEPEGVTVGVVNGKTYAFVGLERVGGVMIYDISDPADPTYVGYRPETSADLGPEVLKFIDASESPTGQTLVVSGNEISNTVTLYSVQTQSEGDDTIVGGSDAETWNGRGGNDSIRGNGGNDTIDGGAGFDLAVFGGTIADSTITRIGATYTVTGPDGTDTVTNVERFQFSDGTIDALRVDTAAALTGTTAVLAHGGEDAAYTVTAADLLAGFTDANGDTLSVSGLTVSNGTAKDNRDGTFTITPAHDFNGVMTLNYSVDDSYGASTAATQSVTFDAVADAAVTTGVSSSTAPYVLPLEPNVHITSILTTGDALVGSTSGVFGGVPDGIGAFDNGDGTFTVLVNHEITNTQGVTRDHGSIGSYVDQIVIDKATLQVISGDDAMKTLNVWNDATDSYSVGTIAFSRFCSGDLAAPTAFFDATTGLGTTARIYLTGEESGVEGRAIGTIVSGSAKGQAYELPFLGNLSFENLTANPTAQAKTIVAATDDGQNGQVYIYVGDKQATGTDIEKAGLASGKLFGIKVAGVLDESNTTMANGSFTLEEIADASNKTGAQIDAASEAQGVTSFLRPEDSAWDPNNPNVLYFTTTNSITGPSRVYKATFTDIAHPELGGTIEAVLDGTEGQKMFDNLTVANGKIILQEDPGNNSYVSRVFEYDIATDKLSPVLTFDPAQFTPGQSGFITQDEESSGVIDVTGLLGGGTSRAYLLDAQVHATTGNAATVEKGQLLLLTVDTPTTEGTAGADLLQGSAAAETFNGYAGNDTIQAGSGADIINAGADNDTITGGAGNDTIDGGTGDDTAVFSGTIAGSTIARVGTTYAVTGPDGTDTVTNVEHFQFSNGTVDASTVNTAPTGLDLTGTSVTENSAGGTTVGTLAATDANADALTYSLTDNAGGRFTVDATTGVIKVAAGAVLDYELASSWSITAKVTDSLGAEQVRTFTIAVTDVVEAGQSYTGTSGSDTFTATSTNVWMIKGMSGNDTLTGGVNADIIDGGLGNDTLAGGLGNDMFQIGLFSGTDAIDGGAGTDTIVATAANVAIGLSALSNVEAISANGLAGVTIALTGASDTIDFSGVTLTGIGSIDARNGNDTVIGSNGADTIIGGIGNDTLSGGQGDDLFLIGLTAGFDRIDGGAGTDTIRATAANAVIGLTSVAGVEVISAGGFAGVKILGDGTANTLDFSATTLSGIAGIEGGGGNDTITGSAGDDVINGGAGNDILSGGQGNDTFLLGNAAGKDTIDGGAGTDTVLAAVVNTVIVAANLTGIEAISGGGLAGVRIVGSTVADTLDYTAVMLTDVAAIDGGAGNDIITGSTGNDTIIGNFGNDTLNGGNGNDVFLVGANGGYDAVDGGAGLDTIRASAANTSIGLSTLGNVEVIDGAGLAGVKVTMGLGNDIIDFTEVTLTDIALIDAGGGNDTITGSAGADRISGSGGNDTLSGGLGNDTLDGGLGNDVIIGGEGTDTLTGGVGADVFRFLTVLDSPAGSGADHIADFVHGPDRIDLSGIDANDLLTGDQAFAFIGSAAFTDIGQVRIGNDGGHTALFANLSGDLAADFEIILDNNVMLVVGDLVL